MPIPVGALPFWEERLTDFQIAYEKVVRFGEPTLQFADPHGLQLEIVEREVGEENGWTFGGITKEVAIKGFAGATLFSSAPKETTALLTDVMGLTHSETEGDYMRFTAPGSIGNVIDVKLTSSGIGTMGVGTVHHIAWRAKDDADHLDWQEYIRNQGIPVTEVRDRNYFNAIYFKEPGQILYEIATDPPGFAHDESLETMGTELKLPEQYEQHRETLNEHLIPIEVRDIRK